MERLNKDTRLTIRPGDKLRSGGTGEVYTVLRVIKSETRRYNIPSLCFTLRTADGRTIYAMPASQLYGIEIDRGGADDE